MTTVNIAQPTQNFAFYPILNVHLVTGNCVNDNDNPHCHWLTYDRVTWHEIVFSSNKRPQDSWGFRFIEVQPSDVSSSRNYATYVGISLDWLALVKAQCVEVRSQPRWSLHHQANLIPLRMASTCWRSQHSLLNLLLTVILTQLWSIHTIKIYSMFRV